MAHALHRNMLAAVERDDALHPQQVGAAQLDEEREEALEQVLPRRTVEPEDEAVDAVVVMLDRRENGVDTRFFEERRVDFAEARGNAARMSVQRLDFLGDRGQ